jgi:hypothetical protein
MDRFAAFFFMERGRPNDGVRLNTVTEGEGMSGDEIDIRTVVATAFAAIVMLFAVALTVAMKAEFGP